MATFKKISDTEIEKTAIVEETKVTVYSIDFLVEQRKNIQAQKDREIAQRDAELAEVDALIAEAEKMGIKLKQKQEEK